jgi:hypothetical protein
MRIRFWRRIAAVLAIAAGIGVAAPAADASAATAKSTQPTTASVMSDWWW